MYFVLTNDEGDIGYVSVAPEISNMEVAISNAIYQAKTEGFVTVPSEIIDVTEISYWEFHKFTDFKFMVPTEKDEELWKEALNSLVEGISSKHYYHIQKAIDKLQKSFEI